MRNGLISKQLSSQPHALGVLTQKKTAMRLTVFLVFLFFGASHAGAQKFMQIERINRAKTEKIPRNTELTYQIMGDEYWYTNTVRDYLVEDDLIQFEDRFVNINNITAFRYEREWPTVVKTQLRNLGLGWSVLALIGTLTDNNPDTNYQWSDAAVTASAFGLSFAFEPLFKKKVVKFGGKKRLRLVDLRFKDY